MEYKVDKEVKVTLELTEQEFKTIVCSVGATCHEERMKVAKRNNIRNLMRADESDGLYRELKEIAMNV